MRVFFTDFSNVTEIKSFFFFFWETPTVSEVNVDVSDSFVLFPRSLGILRRLHRSFNGCVLAYRLVITWHVCVPRVNPVSRLLSNNIVGLNQSDSQKSVHVLPPGKTRSIFRSAVTPATATTRTSRTTRTAKTTIGRSVRTAPTATGGFG